MQDLGVLRKRARGEYVTSAEVQRLRRREELRVEKAAKKNSASRKYRARKKVKEEFRTQQQQDIPEDNKKPGND